MIHLNMKKKSFEYDEVSETVNTTAAFDVSPYIRCIKGEYEGYDIPILQTGILIGRDSTACNLILENTPGVSRYHCKITYSEKTGYFIITDLNSLNGVYTENMQRIPPGEKLVLAPDKCFSLCNGLIIFKSVLQKNQ